MKSNSEKKSKLEKNLNTILTILVLLVILSALTVNFLLSTGLSGEFGQLSKTLKVGQLIDQDIIAKRSFQIIDKKATEEKKEKIEKNIKPVFSFVISAQLDNLDAIDEYYKNLTNDNKIDENTANMVYLLFQEMYRDISKTGYCICSEIEDIQASGYNSIFVEMDNQGKKYAEPKEKNFDEIITTNNIDEYISNWIKPYSNKLGPEGKELLITGIKSLIKPNLVYDYARTLQLRNDATNDVTPVIITMKKGDLIISKDYIVTAEDIHILDLLSEQNHFPTVWETIAIALIVATTTVVGLLGFKSLCGKNNLHSAEFLIMVLFGLIFTIWISYGIGLIVSADGNLILEPLLPMLFVPLFMTLITGTKRLGYVVSFVISIILQVIPGASTWTFFYCLVFQWASIYFVRFMNKRLDMLFQWFFTIVSGCVITIFYLMLWGMDFSKIFIAIGEMVINVSLTYVIIVVLIPIFERLFNLPTVFRLHELAYSDSPVLTRLNNVAPGTYRHSCAVADLAEAACEAIGANALLARVGGLYHDIGKMDHPEYFIENVGAGETNKHCELNPSLSASIIKNHVKSGVEKGREYGLPQEVLSIISNHHGNDVISYFYHEAQKEAPFKDKKGDIRAEDFSYNSDPPKTIVEGVVMLADCVEAASRTIIANPRRFEKMITSITMKKLERGQLKDSNLTVSDLELIRESFVRTLVSSFHSRIEYPDDDE